MTFYLVTLKFTWFPGDTKVNDSKSCMMQHQQRMGTVDKGVTAIDLMLRTQMFLPIPLFFLYVGVCKPPACSLWNLELAPHMRVFTENRKYLTFFATCSLL